MIGFKFDRFALRFTQAPEESQFLLTLRCADKQ